MKKTLLVGLTLGLLLSGCDKDDSLNNIDGGGVRFTTYMVESRATDTAWEAGDEIGVYMQTNAASGYQNINVKYANTEGNVNSFVSENPITYSGNESTVSFMAVYPYNETITDGNYTFTLGNESLSKNDIMYASAPSITAGTTNVTLNFQHKLTKIALQINDADGNAVTDATVSIDKQRVNGVVDVATGTVNATDEYNSTLNFAESNGTYEVIVIPDEGCKGRSIVIQTSGGKTYRCPVENISFGGSKKYTFPVSLQSSSTSSPGGSTEGETIIDLITANIEIDDWTDEKSTGWIISSDAEISTENKTRTELAKNRSLSANNPVEIAPQNDMTLAATDVYCIEYTRTDADVIAATLIVSQPATRSGAAQKTYTLPAGLANGQLVFAVGDFTNGFSVSSTVALTLDAVSVYSEESSGSEDSGETETPSQTEEIEVWTGSHNLGSWNGTSIEYKSEILAKTTEGCTLRFYYTDKTDGAQLQFAGSTTIDVTGDAGYVDMEVTAELITALTENSWPYLNGQNMTVTRIVLIGKSESGSEDSGETETPSQTEEIEVWTGSHNLGSWNGTSIEYKPEILAKTTEGCTLRFYYTDKTDGAQLQFAGTATIDVTDDAGYVDMEVTAELVAALTENSWPYLNGQNMTVTKIVLICPAEN